MSFRQHGAAVVSRVASEPEGLGLESRPTCRTKNSLIKETHTPKGPVEPLDTH